MSERRRVGSGRLVAEISSAGAELVSLKEDGAELLWQAGPEWPRHAPVLFPIVGKLAEDTLRHDGRDYRVTQHGFARDLAFAWTETGADRVALLLTDGPETRERYPFGFRLEMIFAVENDALSVVSRVSAPDGSELPFCIGAHPGFRWPLLDGVSKDDHVIEFETKETGQRRTVEGGLLGPEAPLPFDGLTLPLSEQLFERDALVMPAAASRSVRYVARGHGGEALKALTFSWRGYEDLGIWSAPKGAPFVCVEPWRGMASTTGWDGSFVEKPGVVLLPPGATMEFEWRVAV